MVLPPFKLNRKCQTAVFSISSLSVVGLHSEMAALVKITEIQYQEIVVFSVASLSLKFYMILSVV